MIFNHRVVLSLSFSIHRNKKLLGAPGIATRDPGLTTSNKRKLLFFLCFLNFPRLLFGRLVATGGLGDALQFLTHTRLRFRFRLRIQVCNLTFLSNSDLAFKANMNCFDGVGVLGDFLVGLAEDGAQVSSMGLQSGDGLVAMASKLRPMALVASSCSSVAMPGALVASCYQ